MTYMHNSGKTVMSDSLGLDLPPWDPEILVKPTFDNAYESDWNPNEAYHGEDGVQWDLDTNVLMHAWIPYDHRDEIHSGFRPRSSRAGRWSPQVKHFNRPRASRVCFPPKRLPFSNLPGQPLLLWSIVLSLCRLRLLECVVPLCWTSEI